MRDLKARLAMSFKPKTIAFSVAALLAAAGGIYAFMPGDQGGASGSREVAGSAQDAAKPEIASSPSAQSGDNTAVQDTDAAVAKQPTAKDQPDGQAPKKLTKKQLTPPPLTEEEKLQKAAEQESNF
jgi:hypothetical protein